MARGDRAPAKVWVATLAKVASALSESEANDFVVFGSQAMSVYLERALPSRDLDLVVPGVSPKVLELVRGALGRPEYDFGVFDYEGRDYPVGHFYLRHADGTPLVVELFQTFLGFDPRRLTPYLTFRERWGMRLQVMVPEAVVAARLSFRPPERITPFNAARLSRFVRALGRVDWQKVGAFLDDFGLAGVALENIRALRAKGIAIPGTPSLSR
ncbi:MAG: hypothetical protein JRM80_13970 [Nitrososphaerota archaeon]|nr:hypothetical protein [Nitrososphaerota archaeon]